MTITDYDVSVAMLTFGGSFVQALGRAWQCADTVNGDKLKAAFPEYWEQYREFAQMKAKAKA
jgi:hypothetical protein